jgi:phage tail sheath protein FI
MATQFSYPGVYIREFAPGAPIQGVGTSVAAFIGPTAAGDIPVAAHTAPVKIASFDEFKQQFGDQPLHGFFLWYAVRGFFENGGKECYIVRASNGSYSTATLTDIAGNPMINVRALHPGPQNLTLVVAAAHLLPPGAQGAQLYAPALSQIKGIGGRRDLTLNLGLGSRFRPGDTILLTPSNQIVQIVRITGGDTLRIADDLDPGPPPTTVRLADVLQGADTVRMQMQNNLAAPPGALVPGSMLTITQGGSTDTQLVDSVHSEGGNPPTYRITFRQGLQTGFSLDPAVAIATVVSDEFNLTVNGAPYNNLSLDPAHPGYYATVINGTDPVVRVDPVEPPPPTPLSQSLPAAVANPAAGQAENLIGLNDNDFTGALETLQQVNDVNLVSTPDRFTTVVQQAVINQCEQLADRFAVLDSRPNLPLFGTQGVEELQRPGLESTRGYAAMYYPWIRVAPAGTGAPILVPPSGHVCGIMARSDEIRGVHKAPANEIVTGALDVERTMSEVEHGDLNIKGINVIRRFHPGSRPMLFGARTTATDTNWQYVNIRRLFLFLEKSIQNGIRWAVFEPNNTSLWEKLRRTITDFLTSVWRDGALFGETADKAFYVRIDEALNPDSERALGRLHIEIGVRPSYPAEFIIVRIGIWYGGSQVTEG